MYKIATNQISPGELRLFPVKDLGVLQYEAQGAGAAQVVVVIPLYNYESLIVECIESVAEQDLLPVSIIVIDDASTDGGGKKAISVLRRLAHRFASVRVVRHSKNQGLSMARNSGIAWTEEPYLFMLDADNRIRRPCLSRLLEAIEVSGAAFAYPQLRFFGEVDMLGHADVWEPARLRDGNYIDAMALIRRSALTAVGGYVTLANDHGWEDYELWCRFAEAQYDGVFLPEILGEYRVHKTSMLRSKTNNHTKSLKAEIMLRHPALFIKSRAEEEKL
jgi:glycosyltransferase involved in cell wall biosynthesis